MKILHKTIPLLLALSLTTPLLASDYTNHWAKSSIEKWSSRGIVAGYEDGSFKPSSPVTRAELAAFITRTFGFTDITGARTYTDITPGKWYTDPIAKVSAKGIMYTPGDKFYPNQKVTREEAAYAIYRAYQIAYTETTQLVDYEDYYDISPWAADAVGSLVANGYLKGYDDGTFKPQGHITRAEIVTMLDNLSPHYINTPGTYQTSLKGNVVINSKDVTLKDMTIEGNLYLTEAIGTGKITLDNVKVTGTLYIDGGNTTMSGSFQTVEVASGQPVHLQKGTVDKLIIEKPGTTLTLDKGTELQHLVILEEATIKGEGKIHQTSDFRGEKLQLTSAGVYIHGEFQPIQLEDNRITIDLPYLSTKFGMQDYMSGLQINTNIEGAYINSYSGQMQTNTRYDFRMANKVTGILDEMLESIISRSPKLREVTELMGITGESAFDVLGIDNSVSIYTLIDKYNLVKDLVYEHAGIRIGDEYTFTRQLCYPGEAPVDIEIHLIVNY